MENASSLSIEIILLLAKKRRAEQFDSFMIILGVDNIIGPCFLMLCKTEQG